ncbi:hypothetical protein EYC80_000609 [Monilinia laxa]|uniref:Uncharacterized protein n=1 Tax=Monilinia laxa TaxID=61186 RepID=A0A5N6KB57_MONLA|nr:hypothetical protein EYC80_000609 [Monilinia laxa]
MGNLGVDQSGGQPGTAMVGVGASIQLSRRVISVMVVAAIVEPGTVKYARFTVKRDGYSAQFSIYCSQDKHFLALKLTLTS